MFVFSIIVLCLLGVGLISLFGYMAWKKISLREMILNNAEGLFKAVAFVILVIEIFSLAMAAINRGMDPMLAFPRYSVAGFLEYLFSYYFISMFANQLDSSIKESGAILFGRTFLELSYAWIFFFLSLLFTGFIYYLYLESINQVMLIQTKASILFPYRYIDSIPVPVDPNSTIAVKRIEFGIVLLILSGIIMNAALILHYLYLHSKVICFRRKTYDDVVKKVAEKREEDKKKKDKKDNDKNAEDKGNAKSDPSPKPTTAVISLSNISKPLTGSADAIKSYSEFVESVFEIPKHIYEKKLADEIERLANLSPNKKVEDITKEVTGDFIQKAYVSGNPTCGIGIFYLKTTELVKEIEALEAIKQKVESYLANPSDAQSIANLDAEKQRWNVGISKLNTSWASYVNVRKAAKKSLTEKGLSPKVTTDVLNVKISELKTFTP